MVDGRINSLPENINILWNIIGKVAILAYQKSKFFGSDKLKN
jgi:hypothetical protein